MTLDIEALELRRGSHSSPDEGMCVMEAVSYVAGEEFSDSPKCACPVISAFMRSLNDSSKYKQRQQLKPYILRLVDTNKGEEVAERRLMLCVDWLIREYTPAWLDLANLSDEANSLRSLAPVLTPEAIVQAIPAITAAKEKSAAVRVAAWAAASAILKPPSEKLRTSSFDLLDRMLAVE
jgi:hypothetical protein